MPPSSFSHADSSEELCECVEAKKPEGARTGGFGRRVLESYSLGTNSNFSSKILGNELLLCASVVCSVKWG